MRYYESKKYCDENIKEPEKYASRAYFIDLPGFVFLWFSKAHTIDY
jgi:hypothetical protein